MQVQPRLKGSFFSWSRDWLMIAKPFPHPPWNGCNRRPPTIDSRPLHVPAQSKRGLSLPRAWVRFLAETGETGGSYSLLETDSPEGTGPNPHSHPEAEQWFYV